jgi:hypothetical protein
MSEKRYNQIIDEVYEKYIGNTPSEYVVGNDSDIMNQLMVWKGRRCHLSGYPILERLARYEFIHKCKTNKEFSEKWGLKIEERELSLEERMQIWNERIKGLFIMLIWGHDKTQEESLNEHNIPNKLITLTYQDEKIEVYV